MQLGVTTIQRDRAPWIKEWVVFHYLVGFRKFYIFTHNCKDKTPEIVEGLKKRFDIAHFDIGSQEKPQLRCYQRACDNFLSETDWMAFIDADEFLFPVNCDSMETALSEFNEKNISALGVYWMCYGSSGHITEPPGLILENYKYRAGNGYHNNRHIKSIVRGGQNGIIRAGINPHMFKTPTGTFDENLRPVVSGWANHEPTYSKFRINHYVCQSRSFYENWKQGSGAADGGTVVRNEDWWNEHNVNDVLDNSMERFVGPLKNILNSI